MWSSRTHFFGRRRWLPRLLLVTGILMLGIGCTLMFAVSISSVGEVEGRVDQVASVAGVIRLAMIFLVAVLWRPVVRRLHASKRLHGRPAHDWLVLRGRVVLWMLFLELLVGHNLLGQLIAAFSGWTA